MNNYLLAGFGHLGQYVLENHLTAGDQVYTLSRTALYSTKPHHIHIRADLDSTAALEIPGSLQGIYYFAPPSDQSRHDDRLQQFLKQLSPDITPHLLYLSTSGVYGNQKGKWVDETSPTNPQTERAHRRLSAETRVLEFSKQTGTPVTILRVGGIYSAKTVNKTRLQKSVRPPICEQQAPYTNRIHVEDLATICKTVIKQPPSGYEIYNVSDGRPTTTTAFLNDCYRLAGLPLEDCVNLEQAPNFYSEAYMSYLLESRRMDTSKLFTAFDPDLKFADYREGIKYCLDIKSE